MHPSCLPYTKQEGLLLCTGPPLDVSGWWLFSREESGLDHDKVIDKNTDEVLERFYAKSFDEACERTP